MRVLWLSGNSGRYLEDSNIAKLEGSWVYSLQTAFVNQRSTQLALAFFYPSEKRKEILNGTTYYLLKKCHYPRGAFRKEQESSYLKQIEWVVNDFQPDIIQVFGTEMILGLVWRVTNVPVVVHIQGWMHPIWNAWYPPHYNVLKDDILSYLNPKKRLEKLYITNALNWEKDTCRHVKYFLGRTTWDKNVLKTLSPHADYFYCSELLRPPFFYAEKWKYEEGRPLTIVSVINDAPYKGADVILHTAALLKQHIHFKWFVCGVSNIQWAEKLVGINTSEVNVECLGHVSCLDLVKCLQNCSCFVHLSYIENSPNSVCEAQLIGLPVIATNVGGVSSLVEDGETGLLVSANDAYTTCMKILSLYHSQSLSTKLGMQAALVAEKRHKEEVVVDNLLQVYEDIISNHINTLNEMNI